MESSMINLSRYRYEKAKEQLEKAKKGVQMELPYLEGKWKELKIMKRKLKSLREI